MSKLNQTKIPVSLDDLGNIPASQPKWKLVRERDGLTKQSAEVLWIEWDENGRFKAKHEYPNLGRSLLMSPFNAFFTWQTTPMTGIQEQREGYICFDTENSRYELFKIDHDEDEDMSDWDVTLMDGLEDE